MNQNSVSASEAKSALESVAKLERDANSSLRPPLWLNFIIAASYGMITFSYGETDHENLWALGMIISAIIFFLSGALYYYRCRLLGFKAKLMPKSMSEVKFQLILAVIFATGLVLAKVLTDNGFWWGSYFGGIMNASILSYSLHNFATGQFVARGNDNE